MRIKRYRDKEKYFIFRNNKIFYDEIDMERFWKYVEKTENCWNWLGGLNGSGYGSFSVLGYFGGSHEFSYLMFNGDIPRGLEVRHMCNNRKCVCPDHLKIGTKKENMQDAILFGDAIEGSDHVNAKLTKEKVIEIREKYSKKNISSLKLAKEYGVASSTIFRIVNGEDWKNAEGIITPKGTKYGSAKLKEKEVYEIKRLYDTGKVNKEMLSKMFRVHICSINNIITGKTWKNLV